MQYLERAVEWDPKAAEPRFHLASAYDELGRAAEAVSLYEAIAAEAPGHNPTLLRLARAYRAMGRQGDARAAFERALANNAHEAPATLGLAELEIQQGDRDALIAARNRLDALVNWMPENTAAGVALGVVHHRLGQTDLAIRAYEEVLARNPYEVSALLNLAHIHQAAAEDVRARELFERASAIVPESVEQLVDLQSYFIGLRALDRVGDLWESYVSRRSPSKEGLAYASFGIALAGRASRAEDLLKSIGDAGNELPLAMAANAYLALTKERFSEAASWVDSLCALGAHAAEARRSLQMGLELFDERRPGVAWTLGLAARLLIADQRWDVAGVFLDLFDKNCNDEGCAEFLRSLRTRMTEETSGRSPAGPSVP
jgi:tetratricopeptide (TPR) repeat protein